MDPMFKIRIANSLQQCKLCVLATSLLHAHIYMKVLGWIFSVKNYAMPHFFIFQKHLLTEHNMIFFILD